MAKITVFIGEPATGKSTVMKALIRDHGHWKYDPTIKFIPCHWQPPNRCIIGRYDDMDHQFPGTDRMSMACQPYVLEFIKNNPQVSFVLEGDRLGNQSFLAALKDLGCDLVVVHLWLQQDQLDARRLAERPDQGLKFIKSRVTKINNLLRYCKQAEIPVVSVEHTDESVTLVLASDLYRDRL